MPIAKCVPSRAPFSESSSGAIPQFACSESRSNRFPEFVYDSSRNVKHRRNVKSRFFKVSRSRENQIRRPLTAVKLSATRSCTIGPSSAAKSTRNCRAGIAAAPAARLSATRSSRGFGSWQRTCVRGGKREERSRSARKGERGSSFERFGLTRACYVVR